MKAGRQGPAISHSTRLLPTSHVSANNLARGFVWHYHHRVGDSRMPISVPDVDPAEIHWLRVCVKADDRYGRDGDLDEEAGEDADAHEGVMAGATTGGARLTRLTPGVNEYGTTTKLLAAARHNPPLRFASFGGLYTSLHQHSICLPRVLFGANGVPPTAIRARRRARRPRACQVSALAHPQRPPRATPRTRSANSGPLRRPKHMPVHNNPACRPSHPPRRPPSNFNPPDLARTALAVSRPAPPRAASSLHPPCCSQGQHAPTNTARAHPAAWNVLVLNASAQTSARARVVPTAASASLEVLSSKSIPAKTGEEHIFLQFIFEVGLNPGPTRKNFTFVYSVHPSRRTRMFQSRNSQVRMQLNKLNRPNPLAALRGQYMLEKLRNAYTEYQMNACIHAYYLEASFTISPQTIAPRGWLKSESTSEGGLNRILVGAPVSLPLSSESRAGKRANFHDLPALLECAASTSTSTLKSEPPSTENGLKSAASQGTRENKYSQLTHT
ncbi:hypothetical protein B0H16DRAFT_1470219 [Mycena metata]|uniref:Uncharacterized protein n=1 Tax=Mycena metata TaxID=1033252 RepID=A0AAD7MR53_9AGAR|nr:hypothetical protein B0H16DRAFT_1470219 [Mycena metata]